MQWSSSPPARQNTDSDMLCMQPKSDSFLKGGEKVICVRAASPKITANFKKKKKEKEKEPAVFTQVYAAFLCLSRETRIIVISVRLYHSCGSVDMRLAINTPVCLFSF